MSEHEFAPNWEGQQILEELKEDKKAYYEWYHYQEEVPQRKPSVRRKCRALPYRAKKEIKGLTHV